MRIALGQLAQRAGLDLAHALAGDAEARRRPARACAACAVEAVAQLEHARASGPAGRRAPPQLVELRSAPRPRRAAGREFLSSSRSENCESPSPTGVSSDTGSSCSSVSWTIRAHGQLHGLGRAPRRSASRPSSWVRARSVRCSFLTMSTTCTGRRIVRPWSAIARDDGLADPPGRVGRELEALGVVELLDRPDQAEVALLDQVEQRQAGGRVGLGDRDDEAQVALDQARAWRHSSPASLRRASSRSCLAVSSGPLPIWRT